MDAPRTHYQISLTARQAVGLFASLLVALGVAFFLGLVAGLSGRGPNRSSGEADVAALAESALTPEPVPRIETAVPTAAFTGPSRTLLAGGTPAPTPAAEPTVPAILQPFEDSSSDEPPAAPASPGPGAPASAEPSAGKYWVQVASLTSRDEAGSLQARLSRRGYHAQVLSAAGPHGKGRVYRVRVGPYASEPEAGRAATRLEKQERLRGPWVVPEGQ